MADLINVNHLVICLPADGLDLVDPADLLCVIHVALHTNSPCWVHLTELIRVSPAQVATKTFKI